RSPAAAAPGRLRPARRRTAPSTHPGNAASTASARAWAISWNWSMLPMMRIRALSVFEGVVYHCYAVDDANPCRPTLEVEALVRPGDVDQGPLLVTVADYLRMVGMEEGPRCLRELT